jgi:putative membrane protein
MSRASVARRRAIAQGSSVRTQTEASLALDNLGPADKMASMRTTLAFQRTRMAADRTLMAILRTSLSMIGFGFTIYSFFSTQMQRKPLGGAVQLSPARFGLALIAIGVLLLALGMINHYRYMQELRGQRRHLTDDQLLAGTDKFPISLVLIIALLLMLLGIFAVISIVTQVGIAL